MARIPSYTPYYGGPVASPYAQATFKIGSIYRVEIKDFPWTDAWAQKHSGNPYYLWNEAFTKSKADGNLVQLVGWTTPAGTEPPIVHQGDLGLTYDWVFTKFLTGPFAQPWYWGFWAATHWLTNPAAATTCQCTMQVIWSCGCQCGKP